MGKKSAPAPPDPVATANAQASANKDAAIAQSQLGMVDQYTPYGNLIYSKAEPKFNQSGYDSALSDYENALSTYNQQIANYSPFPNPVETHGQGVYYQGGLSGKPVAPKAPDRDSFYESDPDLKYKAVQTLSPENQKMLDLSNQAGIKFGETANNQLNQVSERLGNPLDFSSLGEAPQMNEQYRQDRYNAILDRLNPAQEQDRMRLETSLANQGIQAGSEAWKRQFDDFNRMVTDSRLAADQTAGNEMSRQYGLELTGRNQGINEMIQQRQIPLNELNAMISGSQVQGPQYVNTPQSGVAPADIAGATYASYQGDLNNFNQKQAMNQAMMGGLFGLGSAGLGAYGMLGGGSGFGGSAASRGAMGGGLFGF